MRIVVLDGYTTNPGDLSWAKLEELGDCTIYDRTPTTELLPGRPRRRLRLPIKLCSCAKH